MIEKKYDIVTIADLCVDLAMSGNIIPEFRQKEKIIDEYYLEMGGSCSIFACQAAKLGLKTAVIGIVGNDVFGELVVRRLRESGVDTSYIAVSDDVKTGLGLALCNQNDRAILTYLGSIDTMVYEDIPMEIIATARHIHIGSYYLKEKIRPHMLDIVQFARANGTTVSLDTNWDPQEKWNTGLDNLLNCIDIFLPNENEISAIMADPDLNNALSRAAKIVPITVVKMGAKGAMLRSGEVSLHVDAPDVQVVDSIGAGDSFDAGFVYGYLKGLSLKQCLEIGIICGSLNTTKPGGISGQPDIAAVTRLLNGYVENGHVHDQLKGDCANVRIL